MGDFFIRNQTEIEWIKHSKKWREILHSQLSPLSLFLSLKGYWFNYSNGGEKGRIRGFNGNGWLLIQLFQSHPLSSFTLSFNTIQNEMNEWFDWIGWFNKSSCFWWYIVWGGICLDKGIVKYGRMSKWKTSSHLTLHFER